MQLQEVILVDEADRERGRAEKLVAHREGLLHRAFSVFVVDPAGRILLQRRALGKYHSGGLWANACCGHPRPGEGVAQAAARRLGEELGLACGLEEVGRVLYRVETPEGLVEHELNRVYLGSHQGEVQADPAEIMEVRWAELGELEAELRKRPSHFAAWLPIVLGTAREAIRGRFRA